MPAIGMTGGWYVGGRNSGGWVESDSGVENEGGLMKRLKKKQIKQRYIR